METFWIHTKPPPRLLSATHHFMHKEVIDSCLEYTCSIVVRLFYADACILPTVLGCGAAICPDTFSTEGTRVILNAAAKKAKRYLRPRVPICTHIEICTSQEWNPRRRIAQVFVAEFLLKVQQSV